MHDYRLRTWAEIDLDALTHNITEIRRITNPNARIMAVVKADAYGHGCFQVAETLLQNGADMLAVASPEEGIVLRKHGFHCPILLLGTNLPAYADDLLDYDITACVTDTKLPDVLSRVATEKGKTAKVHIKVDTGMNRLGFLSRDDLSDTVRDIREIAQLPSLQIEGIFTHFATADEADKSNTRVQFKRFMRLCNALEQEGISIPVRHCCNSAGIIDFPEYHLDMVRPGIILYGSYPSNEVNQNALSLRPVMSLKARISHLKTLPAGERISYGGIYETSGETRVATIPIGYADGWSRSLSGKASVLVHGKKVPIIGRICMDQCMIDVTTVNNISVGDQVVLFGTDADQTIPVEEVADYLNTINYEILCDVSKRIPRVYIKDHKVVDALSFLA